MTSAQHRRTFGRPTLPHTVLIARGDKVRHFTVRPFALALSTALVSAIAIVTFGSATYLVLHNDLVTSGMARQAGLAQAYEDRIAALRSQLDRTVSRQLIDRETVETKVAVLLDQQVELDARYDRLEPLLDRARSSGLLPAAIPIPRRKPLSTDKATGGNDGASSPMSFVDAGAFDALDRFRLVDRSAASSAAATPAAISPELIRQIGEAVESHESRQIEDLNVLAEGARTKADGIADALRSEGIRIAVPADATAISAPGEGGPFVPVPERYRFEAGCEDLDAALTRLQAVRTAARHLPLARPVASTLISSTFGVRSDPFLGRSAMHTGIDFIAESGTSVTATAGGTVVSAGPNGGYGQMVEIDHGDGLVTRYAHLSSVLVAVGETIRAGDTIGKVGSTGRSTGPHLHYEVRRSGEAVDPSGFLRAGTKIGRIG